MVIILSLILKDIIMYMLMNNLNLTFRLKLNKFNVLYVYQMMNKSLLKLNVDIVYVMNVIKN